MPGSTVTIKDIAKKLNVSPSTISRALKNHPNISKETKKRVQELAAKMGYRRNALAAGLRNKHSNTIGLIVPRISMHFQSEAITAIQNTISYSDFNVIISQSNESVQTEIKLIETLLDARVDGVIVSATMFTTDFSPFELFESYNIPVVFYDRVPRAFGGKIIRGDDYSGGYKVGSYLASLGCKDIAFINGVQTCNLYQDRLKGFTDALIKNDILLQGKRTYSQLLTKENAMETCKMIFSKKPYPEAVFCANDTTAIEVHRYVRKLGLKIPSEIKIVGYSNDPRTEIITPAMTTVEQYPSDMGTTAARAMLGLIQNRMGQTLLKDQLIPTDLIIRGST